MEQLALEIEEKTDCEKIREAMLCAIHNPEFDRFLVVSKNKDGTISVKAKSFLVAKVKLTHKTKFFEVRTKNIEHFENYISTNSVDSSCSITKLDEWSRISVKSVEDVIAFAVPMSIVYMLILSEFGGESFGCCARYVECSDEKKCTNPDKMMSFACAYKKNLEAGRIFYGKNKTI